LEWWLIQFFADNLDIFYMFAELGNDEHRNAAQIPRFAKSLCVCNYTQSGWDRPKSHNSKACSNNSDVLGIK
jgi:hypothetical protein